MSQAGTEFDSDRQQKPSGQMRARARTAVLALAVLLAGVLAIPSTAQAAGQADTARGSRIGSSPNAPGSTDAPRATAPVMGGYKSKYGPWAVRMLVDGKAQCTGTAITDQWILSASHCFFDLPDQPVKDRRITFKVANLDQRRGTVVHPIRGSRVPNPGGWDMMLIKVAKMKIKPAQLGTARVKPGQRVRVFGWDATCIGNENSCQSNVLRQADLKVLSYKDARCSQYGTSDGSNVCATTIRGVPTGGDSGGPVMTSAAAGKEKLVGVMWGSDRQSMVGTGAIVKQITWIRKVTGRRPAH